MSYVLENKGKYAFGVGSNGGQILKRKWTIVVAMSLIGDANPLRPWMFPILISMGPQPCIVNFFILIRSGSFDDFNIQMIHHNVWCD